MSVALAFIGGILGFIFAASLLDQYLARRRTYHLLWSVALFLFSVSMLMWFLRETFGMNQWVFRLWYISGATLTPAYLGAGAVYMLAPRNVANAVMGYVLVYTVALLVMVLSAGFRTPEDCLSGLEKLECLVPSATMTKAGVLPSWVHLPAAILNYFGGVAVLAAAVWSVIPLVKAEKARVGGEPAQPPLEAASRGSWWNRTRSEAKVAYRNTVLTGTVLWQNRDFWRRGPEVRQAASYIIITLGLVFGGLGLTLNSIDKSAPHLGLFLVGLLVIYGGFLTNREVLTAPHRDLIDSVRTLKSEGVGQVPLPFRGQRSSDTPQ